MENLVQFWNSIRKYGILPVSLVFLYLFFALVRIQYPGVQYDELQFGNIARGEIGLTFVRYAFHGIPILMMSYVGALKGYLFYPIFKTFGVSAYSIRVPVVLLSASALFFLYLSIKRFFNRPVALIFLFLLATDPSFISLTRYDVGPTVIEFFCKAIFFYCLALFLENKKFKYILLVYLSLIIGLYNKLNFIWFINSSFAAMLIVYWKDLISTSKGSSMKKTYLAMAPFFVGYAVLAGYFFYLSKVFNLFNPLSLQQVIERFRFVFSHIYGLVIGTGFYNYAFGNLFLPVSIYIFAILVLLMASGFVFVFRLKRIEGREKKAYFLFLLIMVFTILQILVTKEAVNIWHYFSIYPGYVIILSYSIYLFGRFLYPDGKKIKLAMALPIFLIAFYQLSIDLKYVKAYAVPVKNIFWSSSINDLVNYAQKDSHKFASADWGTHTQLITFTGQRDKFFEIAFILNDDNEFNKDKQWLSDTFLDPSQNYYFIMHPKKEGLFENARNNLFKLADENKIKLNLIKTFSDNNGRLIYEIYSSQ